MTEIKNAEGQELRKDVPQEEKWWRISFSTWLLIGGLILLNIGCFVQSSTLDKLLPALDVRHWPWEVFVLLLVFAISVWQYRRFYRSWSDYYDHERKHARNFIGLSVTVLAILLFLTILSVSGRFFVFFRPVTYLFTVGKFSIAGFLRGILMVVMAVPLIYYAKEWIVGFWDE